MISYIINIFFQFYILLLFARIALSWFPSLGRYKLAHFVCHYTDPYLNVFRRVIPPIGGMIDVSPMVAFFVLRIVETVVLKVLFSLSL